jgi:hypothetical protein
MSPTRRRRRQRWTETDDFAGMVQRMVRALGRRCAQEDPDSLRHLFDLARLVDDVTADAIVQMREHSSFTWADVGAAAGTTRQAAQMRWGKR